MLLHLLSEMQKVIDMSPFNNLQELAYFKGFFWNSPRRKVSGLIFEARVNVCVCVDKHISYRSTQLMVKFCLRSFCSPFSLAVVNIAG